MGIGILYGLLKPNNLTIGLSPSSHKNNFSGTLKSRQMHLTYRKGVSLLTVKFLFDSEAKKNGNMTILPRLPMMQLRA